ncbi:hypothetical protein [Streptomyces doebereineriae]|uniref:Uncharacterized protein n=1 Tax=Streptomyces doebereineriae TaxID=3075528 RepID=A0ABU2VPR4_9ACTN|nr:hypothetical protein [Streptomyces sp. DSM 41640]MDT0487240.1 hypothetical protein [Streptomyces sp. DSM 41640]
MAALIKNYGRILPAFETRLTTWVFLVSERGDRREASSAAAEADQAVAALLKLGPGKIGRKAENSVWCPASDVLAFRSWLWFVIAVLLGSGSLLLVPGDSTAELYVRIALSLVPAVPSALFASRQLSHILTRRALRTGVAGQNTLVWIRRWLSESAVLILTLGMWALWMTVLVL